MPGEAPQLERMLVRGERKGHISYIKMTRGKGKKIEAYKTQTTAPF